LGKLKLKTQLLKPLSRLYLRSCKVFKKIPEQGVQGVADLEAAVQVVVAVQVVAEYLEKLALLPVQHFLELVKLQV
jgi:hypothetical protein